MSLSTLAALLALLGVALGAFGAHGLKGRLDASLLQAFETGVRYQLYHALALLYVGERAGRAAHSGFRLAGWLFVAGVVLFSGSLYALALTGERLWGAVTPVGGACFLAGWLLLARALAVAPGRPGS